MAGVDWTESTMDAAGTKLHVARAGRGRPLVVLHHETGTLDRLPLYDALGAGFHDQKACDRVSGAEPSGEQLEMWDVCREMSFRIAWKPYMYSQTLPHLLCAVRVPALVVWGDDDKVVPQSAAKRYVEALPNAKLEIVKASGHCVDMEQPEALAKLVTTFIGRE